MGKDTGPLALAAAQVATQRAKIRVLLSSPPVAFAILAAKLRR